MPGGFRRLVGGARPAALAALGLCCACSRESWTNADLQLDVQAALPEEADRVRICVEDRGARAVGARGRSRFAVPGLPAGESATVTVDCLEADSSGADTGDLDDYAVIARAGPITLSGETPYDTTDLETWTGSDAADSDTGSTGDDTGSTGDDTGSTGDDTGERDTGTPASGNGDSGQAAPPDPCTTDGSFAEEDEDTWLLTVRFTG